MKLRELATEALEGVGAKPGRLLISVLGSVVGIGALVLTIGLGQTAAGQLASHFDAIAATHVEAVPAGVRGADGKEHASSPLPTDAVERVTALAGVESAALLGEVPLGGAELTAVPVHDPALAPVTPPAVWAADGDVIGALDGHLQRGRFFDAGHVARGDRVVVLGREAADDLGVHEIDSRPSVFLGTTAYTVIGILDAASTRRELLAAAIIPITAARHDFPGMPPPDTLALRIALGASELVGHQVPIALDSAHPENVSIAAALSTTTLETGVRGDVDTVFFAIGVITLLAGGLGIANVTLLSVSERTGEIGLRRALGASRRQIAGQFVLESLVVGVLGGMVGSATGVAAVVTVSAIRGWTPVLDLTLTLACTALGGAVGLLAGAYPSVRAARIEPAEALRGGAG